MVQKLVTRGERFDVVILDPPRTGSSTLMNHLAALAPCRIIYVSCNPATLGRDIAILKKADYSVIRAVAVDMFPQTAHIESVTLLERD
jgi:23S rRNA (uracil1939-C5)-methyltransferase